MYIVSDSADLSGVTESSIPHRYNLIGDIA
jgi:hypothetical protein